MREIDLWFAALLCVAMMACGGSQEVETSDELTQALTEASAGDVIHLAAGDFVGSFDLPAGVSLEGAGVGVTQIVGLQGLPAVRVALSQGESSWLKYMSVRADGHFAVLATGPGSFSAEELQVVVPVGGGIGLEQAQSAVLKNVQVLGPANPDNAVSAALAPTIVDSATHGIVALGVADASFEAVDINGFVLFGALLVDSQVTWIGGTVEDTVGTGALVHGGSLDASAIAFSRALQGGRLMPAYNVVFAGGSSVTTDAVTANGGQGVGMLNSDATAVHRDIEVSQNQGAGVWIQNTAGVEVNGGAFDGNSLGGIVAVDSSALDFTGIQATQTRAMTRIYEAATVMVGDGLHLFRSTQAISVVDSELTDNARVGVLVDTVDGPFSEISLAGVTVGGTGDQLGAIAQGTNVPTDWDSGISRIGATAINDPAFTGVLGTLDIVGPSDMPAVNELLSGGLTAITGPSD